MRSIMMVDDGFAIGSWLRDRIITYHAGRRQAKDPGVARKFEKRGSKIYTNDQLQTNML